MESNKKTNTQNNQDRLLRIRQVIELFPVSRATWYLGVKEGRYPKPIKIGKRSVAWKLSDIQALIA